jgi:DNA-binding CsgD family transcriptional regulator
MPLSAPPPVDPPPGQTVQAARERARQRETEIWDLRVRGWSQQAIGDKLGISRTAIVKALHRIEARVLARLQTRVSATKARQSGQLEQLLQEAWQSWETSKLPGRKVKRKTVLVKIDGQTIQQPGVEVSVETTHHDQGDPRFLQAALAILDAERRLWRIGTLDPEVDEKRWTMKDIQEEVMREVYGNRSPEEMAKRLAFKQKALRAELAEIDAQLAGGSGDGEDEDITPPGTSADGREDKNRDG